MTHDHGAAGAGPEQRAGGPTRGRPHQVDAIDRKILALLMANGRTSNAALAQATSTAESTTHARVQALREAGVITGVHAAVDPAAIGRGLQALVFVRIHPGMREQLASEIDRLAQLPCVQDVFFLGGHHDFVLRVAVSGQQELRRLVLDDLSSHREIAGTETSIILDHRRGEAFGPA